MVSFGVLLERGIVKRRRVTVTSVTNRFEGDRRAWVCRDALGLSCCFGLLEPKEFEQKWHRRRSAIWQRDVGAVRTLMKLQRRSAISGDVGNDLGVLVEWSCVVGVMNLLWVDKPLLSRFELVRAGMNCIGSERVVLNGGLSVVAIRVEFGFLSVTKFERTFGEPG